MSVSIAFQYAEPYRPGQQLQSGLAGLFPLIEVVVTRSSTNQNATAQMTLVDSGSEWTIFPLATATALGYTTADLNTMRSQPLTGIGGAAPNGHRCHVSLTVRWTGSHKVFTATIVFAQTSFPILGREEFDQLLFGFKHDPGQTPPTYDLLIKP